MVMGENGIFGKANNAKNKTEVAQYEEELRLCVLELQTDSAANGTTFNMDTIKDKFVEKVQELENTTDIEFPTEESETRLDGIYKGYEFYIDDKYEAHIGNKATGIRLTTSINPSGWTQGPVTATIKIKSNNGLSKIVPQGEKEINLNGEKEHIITKTNIAENTSYEYTITDGQGNTQTKTAVINTIDTNPPADFTITAESTEEGLKITGTTTDNESGIEKYEYYVKKSGDTEFTNKGTENPIKNLEAGTYSVYAIAYDKAGNKKSSNTEEVEISRIYSNITAKMVAENPEKYYGLKVTNYESQNGQNDWKIFYSDWKEKSIEQNTENPTDTHIFLITGDYINTAEKDRIDTEATGMKISKYEAYWNSVPNSQIDKISNDIKIRFKATEYSLKSENKNSRCVSTLLNTNNWKKYLDSEDGTGNAEKAIGSPTIEMWMDSWNARYPKDKLYRKTNTNYRGYMVGVSEDISVSGIDSSVMNKKVGYNNKLYYLHPKDDDSTWAYWLASPSERGEDYIISVWEIGSIGGSDYYNSDISIRPVVSLKDGIMVNATDSE